MDIYIIYTSRVNKQTTKESKPRNQETKKCSPGLGSFHNPSILDEILSLTGISAPTSIEIFDRGGFSFPVFHRRAHFSSLINGRWRRRIEEISPRNFSLTDDQTFPSSRSSSPRYGKTDEYESAGRPTF